MSQRSKRRLKTAAPAMRRNPSVPAQARASAALADTAHWWTWQTAGICAALVILVFLVFGQTLGDGFVNYDDDGTVYDVPQVTSGISLHGIAWAFTHIQVNHWDPLTTISHMADCQLYGMWPGGHHLTNVLLHAAAAVLLFLLLLRMTGALWRCAFAAAVWAIHPLRVESVAWITERKDVLSGLFFMLTLLAYFRYVQRPQSILRYCVVALLFVLGLLSKSMLMTLPCVLLLLDYWPLRRWSPGQGAAGWRTAWRLVAEKIPLLLISMIIGVVEIHGARHEMVPLGKAPVTYRAADALIMYLVYVEQMFWPAHLAVLYMRPAGGFPVVQLALAVVMLGLVSAGVILYGRKRPWLVTGWLWYLGMLIPVIGFFQSDHYPQDDRYTYLPQIGLCLAGTWIAADWAGQWRRRRLLLGALASGILCALLIAAWHQTTFWRDSETLWRHTLAYTQDNWLADNDLAAALSDEGRDGDAAQYLLAALRTYPLYGDALCELAAINDRAGRKDEAMSLYRQAIAAYQQAIASGPPEAKAYNKLGYALAARGQLDAAIAHYQKAIEIKPDYLEAHYNLGLALEQKGRIGDAISEFRQALEIDPNDARTLNDLGIALQETGRLDEAVDAFEKAIAAKPDYGLAAANLGALFLQKGDLDRAIAVLETGLQKSPDNADANYNLGAAYEQKGDPEKARGYYEQAIKQRPAFLEAETDLAALLATTGDGRLRDGARALSLAVEANRQSAGNNPTVLRVLASAYAEQGQYAQAVQTVNAALELAKAAGNTALAGALESDLALYQAGKPLRTP